MQSTTPCCIKQQSLTVPAVSHNRVQLPAVSYNRVWLSLLYHTTESDCPCCITQQSPTVPAVSHNRVRLESGSVHYHIKQSPTKYYESITQNKEWLPHNIITGIKLRNFMQNPKQILLTKCTQNKLNKKNILKLVCIYLICRCICSLISACFHKNKIILKISIKIIFFNNPF